MKQALKSKVTAWAAFILVIIYLVCTFRMRMEWWAFIVVFCVFMAAFLNLSVSYLRTINRIIASKLNTWAIIFCILFVVAFVGEWIAMYAS